MDGQQCLLLLRYRKVLNPVNVFPPPAFRQTARFTQITNHKDFDVKTLTSEQQPCIRAGRQIHLWEAGAATKDLEIALQADLPYKRPHWVNENSVRNMQISPQASPRGERQGVDTTIPAEKGDIRNLTNTTGSAKNGTLPVA